ncbi:glutamate--tRNA ligase [Candidatus Peregrinibacteria bacterium]|nr:glutamate--tRNA ligase [Candidatus Peregrinibacteria bacterium]
MVRVRFAPSPTGTFHIGGARTALYNYLFAKNQNGTFILRVEDTDRIRSTPEALQTIYDSLKWLGIKWDEGPHFQSQRLTKYKEYADALLKKGIAYEREDPGKGKGIVAKIERGLIEWDDCIHGKIGRDTTKDPDLVIIKSDGFPTYNFACVVDDIDMKITHVVRGDDHIPNTPKQISLYKSLDAPMPRFAHIPLIMNPDGSKMSKDYKKKGAGGKEEIIPTHVLEYKKMGFLPEAFVNFIALLGWSPGDDREVVSFDEMVRIFSLERVLNHGAQFNYEKLIWMNGSYIRQKSLDEIIKLTMPFVAPHFDIAKIPADKLRQAVSLEHERLKTLADLPESMKFFFSSDIEYDQKAFDKFLKKEGGKEVLEALKTALEGCGNFDVKELEGVIENVVAKLGVKLTKVAQPLRVAITGSSASPPIYDTLNLLGKKIVLDRIEKTLKVLNG